MTDGVRIWQSYSGNNSGDCVLVGRFEQAEEAKSFVDALSPGFDSGKPFSEAWKTLLASEGISVGAEECSPYDIFALGRTVMVHTNSALDDDFPSLRTLLWKRGGRSVYTGIHEHDAVALLAGIGFRDERMLDDGAALVRASELGNFERRGADLFGLMSPYGPGHVAPTGRAELLSKLAETYGAVASAELVCVGNEPDLSSALAARPPASGVERLWARFPTEDGAAAFARLLDGRFKQADRYVVVEAEAIGSRLGYLVQRHGGVAEVISGKTMNLVASFWREKKPRKGRADEAVDPRQLANLLRPKLRPYLGSGGTIEVREFLQSVMAIVDTAEPLEALSAIVDFARTSGLAVWLEGHPTDRLVHSLGRVASDLTLLRKARSAK